jgi:hypothetical protein
MLASIVNDYNTRTRALHITVFVITCKYYTQRIIRLRMKDLASRYINGTCKYTEQPTRGGPPVWGLTTPRHKTNSMIQNIKQGLCIHVSQDTDQLRTLVDTVMNVCVLQRGGGQFID